MRIIIVLCLTRLIRRLCPRIKALDFVIFDGQHFHKVKHMDTQAKELQEFTLTAVETSAGGNQVVPAAVPVWSTTDATIANVLPAADGLSALVMTGSVLGTATITCSVDGFTASDTVTVVAGAAASLSLVASGVIDIPAVVADPAPVVADPVVAAPVAADPVVDATAAATTIPA